MKTVVISNVVVKGYHEFQIRPPPTFSLRVTKEYGNRHDRTACLIWVPELESTPEMRAIVTDTKRGETVETIAGLPIGRVPRGLSSCFWELLSSPDVDSIQWYGN